MEYAYAHTHSHSGSDAAAAAGHAHDSLLDAALHAVEHSLLDTLYLIPFLFVTYLVMEWLEHKTGARTQEAIRRAGAAGPLVGSFLGVVPQCGFSAVAATLYAGRVITLGTLFAVFLSTSDEMLPIFLAEQVPLPVILKILGVKVIIGMVMGFIVDAVLRIARRENEKLLIHELCLHDGCACNSDCAACEANPESVYQHHDEFVESRERGHDHSHDHGMASIAKSALVHTAQVTVFIFAITLVLGLVLEAVGEEALAHALSANPVLSIVLSAVIGLIPNCAASVAIAQLYLEGVLGAGAMMAGLLVSAGVGLLVLLRSNHRGRQNIAIIVLLLAMGVFWGMIVHVLGITF